MSKVEKMGIKDILSEVEPMIYRANIGYIFNSKQKLLDFVQKYGDKIEDSVAIEPILVENEEDIDKEKLVLLLMFNYKENILKLENRLDKLTQRKIDLPEDRRMVEALKLKNEISMQTKILDKLENMSRGIKSFLTAYYYNESEKRYQALIIGAKEILSTKKTANVKALKRFDKVDSNFRNKDTDETVGLEFVLQATLLTDLYEVCASVELGDALRTMILDNNALKRGNITHEELERLKNLPDQEEYENVARDVEFIEILSDVKETLREYVEYIDLDKLLLISAFRFSRSLENKEIDSDLYPNIETILQKILNNISDKKIIIDQELQIKNNGIYELENVRYTVKDLESILSRFVGENYISLNEVQEYKKRVDESEITILNIPAGYVDVIFSVEELNKIALLSEDNLIYVAGKLNWENTTILTAIKKIGTCSAETITILKESEKISVKEIVELYECSIISLETIKQLKDTVDLSMNVNIETINEYYIKVKQNHQDEEVLNRYNKHIELYKSVYMSDKLEELEESSSLAMATIIENFEGNEYDEAIKEYYKNGLITLDSIAEWSNEDLVIKLYNEQIISLKDLECLTQKGKLAENYIVEIYENSIWDNNLSQEQRVDMLSKGWISIETIEKLFRKNLLDKDDLRRLVGAKIISEEKKEEIIESLSLEEAEANSTITLAIDDNVEKLHGNERVDGNKKYPYPSPTTKSKIIISPNAREEFFKLLGAKKVRATKIDEDNPFYHYQFYIIPGNDGKIHLNSPVIAERYFEDKETERNFATENATYFFQYGDLMVLSKYAKKDDVVGKKENVVFRSNHTIATQNRKGKWASSVMLNIIKTSLAPYLKDFTLEQQRDITLAKFQDMYTISRIKKILMLEEEIDSGKHLYEVVSKRKTSFNIDDDGLR